jgi:hypothetical protein
MHTISAFGSGLYSDNRPSFDMILAGIQEPEFLNWRVGATTLFLLGS